MSTESAALHPVIRFLNSRDLDRIMEIEDSAYPFPWTHGIFSDCLRVGYDCRGLQLGSSLIGYSVQTHAAGECHLLNLCIDPVWQGRKFGSLLLEHVIRVSRDENSQSVLLEVRPSNKTGIALYRKRGFYVVGERPDYYRASGGRESALVMRLDLDELPNDNLSLVPGNDPF
jgi:ribosomal-protein-alanine N-acetyltransferase